MNTSAEQAWSQAPDAMAQIDDLGDLDDLFEFGDIGLGPAVGTAEFGEHLQQPNGSHPHSPFGDVNEGQAMSGTSAQDFNGHGASSMSQHMDSHPHSHYMSQPPAGNPYTTESMYQPALQQTYHSKIPFHFHGQQNYVPNQHIPPTPNSFDMHGEAGRFMQLQLDPQQRAMLEQRYQLRKEDAVSRQAGAGSGLPLNLNQIAFTPMASPAGTPQYTMQPEYTIPGAYFSPLTSPMLHAQMEPTSQPQTHQGFYTHPTTAPTSNATSPFDSMADVDMLVDETSMSENMSTQVARRSNRRKAPAPRSVGPVARVKQSPIQKAVKRKSGTMLSSMIQDRDRDSLLDAQRLGNTQPRSAGLSTPAAYIRQDSSENGSISPEPLSESLMGPPPRPTSSLTQSPAIPGQPDDATAGAPGKAATPKSLFSMQNSSQSGLGSQGEQSTAEGLDGQMPLEELELPAAAADDVARRPLLPQLITDVQSGSAEDTPRITARKTPKLGPLSTPASARPSSAAQSPMIGSPMMSTPGVLLKDKRADSKTGRGNKKRSSVGANGFALMSPALRPRISPSIKPLLPEGAVHSPNHALLLASKSNYQNLLEGNHLPGVSYPDSLSTGLTSKRTSHKVAEQGRRNRINEALKEMQSLLPKAPAGKGAKESSNSDGSPDAGDEDGKESKEDAAAKSNSSKAATVESANEYIRKLQRDIGMLLQIKQEHDEMKKRLGEPISATLSAESSSSALASDSPDGA